MATGLLDNLPLPERLALSYAPRSARPMTLSLMALDTRLGTILRGRREPIAAQLRLAWWRDRLREDPASWPRGEPLLDRLRIWRDPVALAGLPSAWEALLADTLTPAVIEEFAEGRALPWSGLARELAVAHPGHAAEAARVWAAADLAHNLSNDAERSLALAYGARLPPPPRLPRSLRTLAVLAELGRGALARGGGPLLSGGRSALLALRIGLTGS